jgi:hypothetical protein
MMGIIEKWVGNGAAHSFRRCPMWVIELNIAGHQFTHQVPERRQRLYRLASRKVGWRPTMLRNQHAA